MVQIDIPYSKVKHGRRYFQPTPELKAMGFEARALGPEGPEARAEAWRLYESWKKAKLTGTTSLEKVYPMRSIGWAFERYRRTDAWKAKMSSTRRKGWEPMWRIIEPIFGDVDPRTVQIEAIEELYAIVMERHGKHDAHRLIKIWRALWKVMAAMALCERDSDPSKIIRNKAPRGRTETWAPGEIARIAKRAWREGFHGIAALVTVSWDTQFSPVDCRKLTAKERTRDARGEFFDTSRGKTGQAVLGTLTRRSVRVLDAYLGKLCIELHGDAVIFRNRSGKAYTADTLGDDFRTVRNLVFPGDKRMLLDIRRSGAVEAVAGEADPASLSAKMGNSIDQNRFLQETYLPRKAATVRLADEARKRGRTIIRGNKI